MKIFTQLTDLPQGLTNTAIALGTFDGIHIGHKKIVQRVIQFAKLNCGTSVMFTFSNHPRSVLFPNHAPKLLMSQGEKAELLEKLGLDMLVAIPFTTDFLKFSPDEFVQLLMKRFQPALLVVGANYCYGYKGQGTSKTLLSAGQASGFAVEVSPIVTVAGQAVSSTTIRTLIENGQVKRAAMFLGQLYELEGPVVDGDKRGRVLGFPTANIFIEQAMLLPSDGVYAVQFILNNQIYQGLANVGVNPTFRGEERRLEVFLLNFSGDLYGEKVRVAFLDKIRHEMVFQSGERLVEQIQQDIAVAKRIFSLQ